MAMKDWKRISNFKYIQRYDNKKTHESLVIAMDNPVIKDWIVYSWKLSKKSFKSKTNALKFAKHYMRTH